MTQQVASYLEAPQAASMAVPAVTAEAAVKPVASAHEWTVVEVTRHNMNVAMMMTMQHLCHLYVSKVASCDMHNKQPAQATHMRT